MKEITVLSGKGGAGKTLVTAALASVCENAVFCDNDVDAADLHLIFNPEVVEKHAFESGNSAFINREKCIKCGACKDICRFDAVYISATGEYSINPFQCEGCRLCERLCSENAIITKQNSNNFWFVSKTRFGTLVYAKMGPGEENSGRLVTEIRRKAKDLAIKNNARYIVNDGPPGIGCTAIASVTGTNLVLIVIEPSVSGLHDAKRLIKMVQNFSVVLLAVINKFDLSAEFTSKAEHFLQQEKIPLLGKVPFSETIVEALIHGKTILEFAPEAKDSRVFREIWKKIESIE